MRTTITLDDDVAAMLAELQKSEQKSFKQVVNELLRLGLVGRKSAALKNTHYSTPSIEAGQCKYPDLDNIGEVLDVAEQEHF